MLIELGLKPLLNTCDLRVSIIIACVSLAATSNSVADNALGSFFNHMINAFISLNIH